MTHWPPLPSCDVYIFLKMPCKVSYLLCSNDWFWLSHLGESSPIGSFWFLRISVETALRIEKSWQVVHALILLWLFYWLSTVLGDV